MPTQAFMVRKSPLDDPRNAAFAWKRFKRIMRAIALLALALIAAAFVVIWLSGEPVSIHFYAAVAIGIAFTLLLTGGLMSLVFLSSGTGHDEAVEDPLDDRRRR